MAKPPYIIIFRGAAFESPNHMIPEKTFSYLPKGLAAA